MQKQFMEQNSFFLDAIDCEAIKSQANAHHQKSLPGILKNTCELYVTY